MTIYHNKIALQAFQHELVGVVVKSKEMYEDQKAIFQLAWQGARVHVSL